MLKGTANKNSNDDYSRKTGRVIERAVAHSLCLCAIIIIINIIILFLLKVQQ